MIVESAFRREWTPNARRPPEANTLPPGAVRRGRSCDTRTEAEADFPVVLREYLEAMLAGGQTPPVPAVQTA
jgi:hypothetical protein